MDKKLLFNETLTSFVEFAATKNNEITSDDVKQYFKDLIEDESQYRFIYDYLTINKIKIKDFVPDADTSIYENFSEIPTPKETSDTAESEEELSFIQMYMEDMAVIVPADDEEKESLVTGLLNGDLSVVNRLVELNLSLAAEIAKKYRGKGVTFGDLIQEGNMGLMLGVSEYTREAGDFDKFITSKITDALEAIVNSQINSERIGQHLADKLNQLDTVTKNLSEELGRIPDVGELAKAMSITEEEVSILLKTSLDTLSVNEDTRITPEHAPAENDESSMVSDKDPLQWRIHK